MSHENPLFLPEIEYNLGFPIPTYLFEEYLAGYKNLAQHLHLSVPQFPKESFSNTISSYLPIFFPDNYPVQNERVDDLEFSPFKEYLYDLLDYGKKMGVRLIPPNLYLLVQAATIGTAYSTDTDMSSMPLSEVGTILVGAHMFNLGIGAWVMNRGGEPINVVSFMLAKIMKETDDTSMPTVMAASSIVASKLFVFEMLKFTGGNFVPDEYKVAALTIAGLMVAEGLGNYVIGMRSFGSE